jgi:protein-L-isoaspartate(D-aspartate) O-methyltransferase
MSDYDASRVRMIEDQLERRGIADPQVLAAMRRVPREAFVPEAARADAYRDGPVSIGEGQTISQPYIVARMAELAALGPQDVVLDVGAGSGYAAAVLAEIAGRVYAIERIDALTRRARATLSGLGYHDVELRTGDGTRGWLEAAPFDAILVAAAGPVPKALCRQLKIGGRLVMPVTGPGKWQELKRITRTGENSWSETAAGGVSFVPLISGDGENETS